MSDSVTGSRTITTAAREGDKPRVVYIPPRQSVHPPARRRPPHPEKRLSTRGPGVATACVIAVAIMRNEDADGLRVLENEVCWLKEERRKVQELLVRANDAIKSISMFGLGFMYSDSDD